MNAIADVRYLSNARLEQVDSHFDAEMGIYWAWMNPRPRACFNRELLSDLSAWVDTIENAGGTMADAQGRVAPVHYAVIASRAPGVFNLGGDLALFRSAIERRDRATLAHYGHACIDVLYRWYKNANVPLTTISLVQGEALGGGFECALGSSVLIAEEDARMGFPEVLFNLFPGMGAYSFLSRKVGRRTTDELITSGAIYTARQLYDMGVVDVITPTGTGEAAVQSYVRKHQRAGNGRRGIEAVAKEMNPLTRDELVRVVELWADAALRLTERDLKMMDRLVRAQQRIQQPADAGSNVVQLAVGAGD